MRNLLLAAFAAALTPALAAASPQHPGVTIGVRGLEVISERAPGQVGIMVVDPATGRRWSANGDKPFPLASVMKLAVAAKWLADVDAGKRQLDTLIVVPERLRLGSDGIGQMMPHPGVTLSAANLIELMITVSDNTATDVLMEQLGGAAAIQRWLTAEGIGGFRIDRPIANLLLDTVGIAPLAGKSAAQTLWASEAPLDPAAEAARTQFMADPRDTASANAVARLIERIEIGKLLKPDSRGFLLGVMGRTRTGKDRLPGKLPEGAKVEHKTGTLKLVSNDAGILTRPDGKRIIVVVMVAGSADPKFRAEIIADAARVAWDLVP